MNISPLGAAAPPHYDDTARSSDQITLTRELSRAVQTLNASSFAGNDRELTFSFDAQTKLPVVRVLDANTHEVLQQFPAEYILRLTGFLQSEETKGETSARK